MFHFESGHSGLIISRDLRLP